MNELLNYQLFFYMINVTSECLNKLDLFQETFQPFGKNVLYDWCD